LFSVSITFYLIPLISKIAHKWGILDYPDGRIKVHKHGIPYLGGIAVYIPFIATLALFYPFNSSLLWLIVGVTLLLFVGLIDDLLVLSPLQKFAGQIIAVLCFLKGGVALRSGFFSDVLNIWATGFWMLSVINAFNLIDVMDGLSSLIGVIAGIAFFIIAYASGNYLLSLLIMIFICPFLVFFYYNKPPASIYLGDSGALFLGGFLAAVPLLVSWSSFSLYGYLVPFVILAIPLLEVGGLIVLRTAKGIPFYRGSPHHFAILLQKKGWDKGAILLFAGTFAVFLGLISFCFLIDLIGLGFFVTTFFFLIIAWFFVIFSKSQWKQ
jgi:UDP-GlcNAc:undecaprenyl-phosphate GlcNAc-1-phosphate transferase